MKPVEDSATARPWRAKTYRGQAAVFGPVHPVDGGDYAPLAMLGYMDDAHVNAALIVTAVNAYEDNKAKIEALTAVFSAVLTHYETALRMLHRADHESYEHKHCSIVVCEEGRSNISAARALIDSPDTKREKE